MSKLNEQGWEIPDQTPVAVPAYIKKYDQRDHIKALIRQELSREAEDAGYETWEEADDFDVGDDYDPTSPYEEEFDPQTGASLWDAPLSVAEDALSDASEATPVSPPGAGPEGGTIGAGNSDSQAGQ